MRLALLGDIALGGRYSLRSPDYKRYLEWLRNELEKYDYVIANLETPLTALKKTMVPKSFHLRADCKDIEILKYLNVDAVSLANNHIYDFGMKGVQDTIRCLEKNGIGWYGIGGKSLLKEIGGNRLCISGFCCYTSNPAIFLYPRYHFGVNLLTYNQIKQQLECDKKLNGISICSIHWGMENTKSPNYEHIHLFQKICDINTLVIHGHHPHIIQGIQKQNTSLVAYSLGNCLFDDCKSVINKFILKQQNYNKISAILGLDIENNKIEECNLQGYKDTSEGVRPYNIDNMIKARTEIITNINSQAIYENVREKEFLQSLSEKFGPINSRWFFKRLNYYSIFARLNRCINECRYKYIKKNF